MSRCRDLPHALPLLLPASYLMGLHMGNPALLLAPACVLFAITPLLDAFLPRDRSLGRPNKTLTLALPTIYVALHAACLVLTATALASGTLDLAAVIGAILSLGAIGGVSITASHDLLHGASRWGRRMGRCGMLLVAYGHFEISHLYGHHRNAGTAADHSTAWHGESLYRYLARTIPACYRLARVEALRRGWRWSINHPLSPNRSMALVAGLALLLTVIGGVPMLVIYACQAAVAILLLEATSYIQHYGLLRSEHGGTRERTSASHSWDSDHATSNALLFRLPRHADHHLHAGRSFTELEGHEAARPLPAGYPTMILLALFPPWWRRVMHPLLTTRVDERISIPGRAKPRHAPGS